MNHTIPITDSDSGSGRRSRGVSRIVAMLALVAMATAAGMAAPPPAPWAYGDIGGPRPKGNTDVTGNNIWTVQGAGTDIWTQSDSFHFTYRLVKGDGSISARFLNMEGGDHEWSRAGLMIRESDADGSPNLNYAVSPAHGLVTTVRSQANARTELGLSEVGPSNNLAGSLRLFVRLQRMGQKIAGFFSRDGDLWSQADFPAQTIATLREDAFFGMAVTSHKQGEATKGLFDQVEVRSGASSVFDLIGSGADRSVLLQWPIVSGVLGYNVYRGPAGAARDQLQRLNANRVTTSSYLDQSAGLVNGTPMSYAVAAVVPNADGSVGDGPLIAVQATPVPLPFGWAGCNIMRAGLPGSVSYDPATASLTLRGSGGGILGLRDELYFMNQLREGDLQITTRMLTSPSHTTGRAGLMIREGLEAGARNAMLVRTAGGKLLRSYREATNDGTASIEVDPRVSAGQPILLRLSRRGSTIRFEYSTDGGTLFKPASPPLTFDPPLERTVYVGIANTATDRSKTSDAKFDLPKILEL